MQKYKAEWIENAKGIYETLLELEQHLANSPEPDPHAQKLVKRLHRLLNRLRRLVVPELSWEQFVSVLRGTPVESDAIDPPADPQSGGGSKDDDDDEVQP